MGGDGRRWEEWEEREERDDEREDHGEDAATGAGERVGDVVVGGDWGCHCGIRCDEENEDDG